MHPVLPVSKITKYGQKVERKCPVRKKVQTLNKFNNIMQFSGKVF